MTSRIASRHHLVISTKFDDFSAKISLSEAISTKKLLNFVYETVIDVCLQL